MDTQFTQNIFSQVSFDFKSTALSLFNYQYQNCDIYRRFCDKVNKLPTNTHELTDIPFLPVEFFKTHKVISRTINPSSIEKVFISSGTTGQQRSKHYVQDLDLYKESLLSCFKQYYGSPDRYNFYALLPGYLENKDASLTWMLKTLMEVSGGEGHYFFNKNYNLLKSTLLNSQFNNDTRKVFIIGVSFALLEFSKYFKADLSDAIVMETGGMKGRGREMIREELHSNLKKSLNCGNIHSEYGMTELLSQAYSRSEGVFHSPQHMKIYVRDIYDPMHVSTTGKGLINIIDLANVHSCAFIATQDVGNLEADGSFKVTGRFDQADIRGCNLLF